MQSEAETADKVQTHFSKRFGNTEGVLLVRSPGRINLIGEHTDYNDGFVLPSAIDRAIYMKISARRDSQVNLYSVDFDKEYSFNLDAPLAAADRWANYLIGVIDQFLKGGHRLSGFDCAYSGNIPIGAGMSSSAAVEAGLAFALAEMNSIPMDRRELARIAQRAENEFVGVNCGIMDQFANLLSKGSSALHLDCRTLEFDYVPFDNSDLKFVLCDSGVKHELASSEYNQRRRQCESGVALIRKNHPEVKSLRDVGDSLLQEYKTEMDPVTYKRCDYVLRENARVGRASELLRAADFNGFGKLLYDSHNGLRDQYEVSCEELDILVEAASGIHGVLGSRMMGGGFGGCTLNLVASDSVHEFSENISAIYSDKTGQVPKIYECVLTEGTNVVNEGGTTTQASLSRQQESR